MMNNDEKITLKEIIGAAFNFGIFCIVLYALMYIATLD